MLETLMLSRIQFAANISFHILFPTITIALGWMLVFFKLRFNRTQDSVWLDLYYFWVKVFALTFALGVVSGITMSFQFGTNWPGFMERVGNVAGPLLGYEVMTAFFMEATFLGVMLFGRDRVADWVHTLATILVAVGTSLSAFWILVLNSWMHTPAGYELIDGIVHVTSWKEVILNPSLPYRLAHTLLASGLTASFLIAGISAYQYLKKPDYRVAKTGLKVSILAAAGLIPVQIFVGDLHGLNTLEHQPEKIAAMEGVWETQNGAPLLLFAIPDEDTRSNALEIGIPKLASLILTHDLNGELIGLNDFEDHPPVSPLFYGFRIMVGMGVLMLLVASYGAVRIIRKRELPKPYLYGLVAMTFSGWIATLAGWYVTEIGRQPWLVNGVLRTSEAVTTVPSGHVMISLTMYLMVYVVLLVAYIRTLFYLARKAIHDAPTPSTQEAMV
ncbi:cytochrome D ubiquinol oxidase subunit I [Enterovibrio norvegicus FF-454]|uniref:Cytochrome D ubiquinol oxidase subunit I n=1 Tax=Enterovibrio norvegicus FF-454 TaxID=1185651 RepID=A0A1E5C7Q9_9GAMM|nr:cytochrome ubiquinol oxidase subunit I [Enterovibrio norvegicus]OEE61551.1 cytochrome D ubiquinol oxidase subunit I [Enterovibrio norvegicus FF-454]